MNQPRGQIVKASDARGHAETLMNQNRLKLQAVLPKHLGFERMAIMVTKTMVQVPKLCECSPASLLGAVMQACQLGLEIDNGLGHAYILPYYNSKAKRLEATFIAGYKGYIDLAWRSGKVKSIRAKAVYKGDIFDYEDGLEPILKHKPLVDPDPVNLTHTYAIIELVNGGRQHEVLRRSEIDLIKALSRANSGPWVTHYAEMAKKTALRKMLKYAPLSAEIAKVVALDEMADGNIDQGLDAGWVAVAGEQDPIEATVIPEESIEKEPDFDGFDNLGGEK